MTEPCPACPLRVRWRLCLSRAVTGSWASKGPWVAGARHTQRPAGGVLEGPDLVSGLHSAVLTRQKKKGLGPGFQFWGTFISSLQAVTLAAGARAWPGVLAAAGKRPHSHGAGFRFPALAVR